MVNIFFATRDEGEFCASLQDKNTITIDVSSYGQHPFKDLSPFTYSKDFEIPVPGMEETSQSVEGIWQGLKIIDSEIDTLLFKRKPKKRRGHVEGHKYFDEILGIEDARHKIYIPSYHFFLKNYAHPKTLNLILAEQRSGRKVYLYDVEDNGNLQNPEPLAHASVLAAYLNMRIFNTKLSPINKAEEKLYAILDSKITNEEKVDMIEPLLENPAIAQAFQFRCIEHPQNHDDYYIAKYFRGLND